MLCNTDEMEIIMNYINTLHEGDKISTVYFCKQKIVATTKAGKTYYSLILQDKTGSIDGKIWELNNGIEHFETKDFIKIDGMVTSFNNSLQMNIKKVRRANEGEFEPSDFMPTTEKNVDEMYSEMTSMIDSIEEEHMKQLLRSFYVDDADLVRKFKNHSAAKAIHHGFIGGLLQHTLAVAKICDFYAANYPIINRDLIISAALLHDIGKLDELSPFPENDYTDDGNLIGHITLGAMMVRDRIKEIPEFPEELGKELIHCILAHHGELEFGSPKKPSIVEAYVLAFADNTDAKIETFIEALNKGGETKEWLGYNKTLDSNIRRT